MKVKIDLNLEKFAQELMDDDFKTEAHELAYQKMYNYIPYKTGALSGGVNIDKTGIEFIEDYAPYVYENSKGRKFNTNEHEFATDHWDKAAIAARGDEIIKGLEVYLLRRRK